MTRGSNSLDESKRKRSDYAYDAMITLGIDNCPRSVSRPRSSVACGVPSLSLSLSLCLRINGRLHDGDGREMMK